MASLGSIFLGAPGSGKGTQAKRLQAQFKIPHISTGDILRSEVSKGSALGNRVKEIMSAGKLVDDDLMTEVVRHRFQEKDVDRGFILDGFPRTVKQAGALQEILKDRKLGDPLVVYMDLPKAELVQRLLGRLTCPQCGNVFHRELNPPKKDSICDYCGYQPLVQRKDDTVDTVNKRLEVFENETAVLLNYYAKLGKLVKIDGTQNVDSITEQLKDQFSKKARA